jgi:SAM-dependent methyltransferase
MWGFGGGRSDAMRAQYIIAGGVAGKERLDLLARVCKPGTNALLDYVGIRAGARCLDVGCGGGHVSRELAKRAGITGSVVAIDFDETVLELARADTMAAGLTNVVFRCGDVTDLDESGYDVVFARFLLSHVGDSALVVERMVRALKPGGTAIVEDTDFTGCRCHPPSAAYDRYVALYRETVCRRGGNADLGLRLPTLLAEAGLERIGTSVFQACGLDGEVKLIPPLTLERIADAVVAEGVAVADDVTQLVAELHAEAADPTTLMLLPRTVQAWGTKSASRHKSP